MPSWWGKSSAVCGAQVPYFPPTQSLADFSEEVCARLLAAAIGDGGEAVAIGIHSVRAWTMHAEVAERFQVLLATLLLFSFCPCMVFCTAALHGTALLCCAAGLHSVHALLFYYTPLHALLSCTLHCCPAPIACTQGNLCHTWGAAL